MTIFVSRRPQLAVLMLFVGLLSTLLAPFAQAQIGIVNVSDRGAVMATASISLNRAAAIPMLNSANGISNAPGAIQLWPRSVSWDRASDRFIEYYVQPDTLRMGIRYNYNFTFNLQSRDILKGSAQVPDGWYLLTMAVVLPEQTDVFEGTGIVAPKSVYERFVTSYNSFVYVSAGSFNHPVSMSLDNITANGVMSNLFIELLPLADKCPSPDGTDAACITINSNGTPDSMRSTLRVKEPYVPYVISLPFTPYVIPSGGSRDPDLTGSTADAVVKRNLRQYLTIAQAFKSKTQKSQSRKISPAQLAKESQLTYISVGARLFKPFKPILAKILDDQTPGSIGVDLKTSERLISLICDAFTRRSSYYQKNSKAFDSPFGMMGGGNFNYYVQVYDQCRNQFSELVTVTRIIHVDRFDPTRLGRVLQQPLKFNLMSNVLVAKGVSDDVSFAANVTQKIPFGILFAPLDAFGFSVSGTMSVSHTENRSSSASVAGSLAANLDFNVFVLNLHATKARTCLAMKLIPNQRSFIYNQQPGAKNGFYICEPKAHERNVKEIYARVLFHPGPTPDVDIYDPLTQKTNFSLRGDRDISAFFYLTSSNITPSLEAGNRVMPYQVLSGAEGYFASTRGNDSNTVVTPVVFHSAKDSVPSFTGKLRDQFQEFGARN